MADEKRKNANDPIKLAKSVELQHSFEELGEYVQSNAIVSLDCDRAASYRAYVSVRNELQRAYNTLREELCFDVYGQHYETVFEEATGEKRKSAMTRYDAIKTAVPIKISEKLNQ